MTADEFQSKRAALITLLTQRVGQQNWRLTSEVCADLLDLENEWHLSQPLSIPQPDSAQYQLVVDKMNAQAKLNSLDMHIELLKAARDAVIQVEARFANLYQPATAVPEDWIVAIHALKAAVDRYGENL